LSIFWATEVNYGRTTLYKRIAGSNQLTVFQQRRQSRRRWMIELPSNNMVEGSSQVCHVISAWELHLTGNKGLPVSFDGLRNLTLLLKSSITSSCVEFVVFPKQLLTDHMWVHSVG
jgi:hypothetical protein